MEKICAKNKCTACKACQEVCSRQAIDFKEDATGSIYPIINQEQCVDCGACVKHCPNNQELDFKKNKTVYVAWNNDTTSRKNGASGGVASAIYDYCLNNNIKVYGVTWNREYGCKYIEVRNVADIKRVINSKYVYSDTDGVYKSIKEQLKLGEQVVFIGLPCQVAGLYSYLAKDYSNLLTVDIICHGVAPTAYLNQHLEHVEGRKGKRADRLLFRDPKYVTNRFRFTLYNQSATNPFYKRYVDEDDVYQIGYHRALIYRENCYNCSYAKRERLGDLTIGDFSGVGSFSEYAGERFNINCVLQNTDVGGAFLKKLNLSLEERDPREAFENEGQLNHPSIPHLKRQEFLVNYESTSDFERAASIALQNELVRNKKLMRFQIPVIKNKITSFIPYKYIYKLKKLL